MYTLCLRLHNYNTDRRVCPRLLLLAACSVSGMVCARSQLSHQRTELWPPRAQRESEPEYGAYADAALHRQVPAMRLRYPGGHGQAQSGVARAATTRGVHAVEGLEEVRQVLRLNAGPSVPYRDHGAATHGTRAQADGTALRGVGDGVVQQVGEGLAQFERIATGRQRPVQLDLQRLALACSQWFHTFCGLARHHAQVERGPCEELTVVLDTRQGQKVADQRPHARRLRR